MIINLYGDQSNSWETKAIQTLLSFVNLIYYCRSRMQMGQNQALYLLVNNRSMLSLSLTLAEVYAEHANPDGFLYVTYASQEVFGNCNNEKYATNTWDVSIFSLFCFLLNLSRRLFQKHLFKCFWNKLTNFINKLMLIKFLDWSYYNCYYLMFVIQFYALKFHKRN